MARVLKYTGSDEFLNEALSCCSSVEYAEKMRDRMPFHGTEELLSASDEVWRLLPQEEKLKAISAHPRIGKTNAPAQESSQFSNEEQRACSESVNGELARRLQEGNDAYYEKFGFIFLICATGKTAEEILCELNRRLQNPLEIELRTAEEEKRKIIRIRLKTRFR